MNQEVPQVQQVPQNVDVVDIQSRDWLRKIRFAKALGGDLGAAVIEQAGAAQPGWDNLISKVGMLMWKNQLNQWEPGLFFVYNGFLACCDIFEGYPMTVEAAKINLNVSMLNFGAALPLPMKGCWIKAGKGEVKHFSVLIPIPGQEGKLKQLDLAANSPEEREHWIEEIYQASIAGEGYGQRQAYVPKKFEGKSAAEVLSASGHTAPSNTEYFKQEVTKWQQKMGISPSDGRSCGNDTCMMM